MGSLGRMENGIHFACVYMSYLAKQEHQERQQYLGAITAASNETGFTDRSTGGQSGEKQASHIGRHITYYEKASFHHSLYSVFHQYWNVERQRRPPILQVSVDP